MKYRNKSNNEIIEAKGYVQEFAYSHNSNYGKVEEQGDDSGNTKNPLENLTVAQLREKLTELGIVFEKNSKKPELLALFPDGKVEEQGDDGSGKVQE